MRVRDHRASARHAWLGGNACRRSILSLALAVLLAACATSINSLTELEIKQLRITEVKVVVKPGATITWTSAEDEYLSLRRATALPVQKTALKRDPTVHASDNDAVSAEAQRAMADRQALLQSPEARAFLEHKLSDKINARAKAQILPQFQGQRSAVLEVEVHSFVIAHMLQKMVLGGSNLMFAITTLRDPATGRELAKLDQGTAAAAGNGLMAVAEAALLDAPEDRMVANYVDQVERWLKKR